MEAQSATINGAGIYFEDVGKPDGEPILFSHCLLWNGTMYDAQIAGLREQYRCITYDHRGQGRSADHDCDTISVEMLCDDAAELITQLGLPPVHFVGHSLGGFVGIMLAIRHPQLVRSLILCNTSGDAEPKRNLGKFRFLNAAGRYLGSTLFADSILNMIFDGDVLAVPEQRQRFREMICSNRRTIWRAVNGVLNRPSQLADLHKIRARTLVITSTGDTMRTPAESESLAAGIPDAQLVCLSSGRHMLPLEVPAAVTELIERFVRDGT
jgi:pimeloyl-ACP methyl ester carboxylesterase